MIDDTLKKIGGDFLFLYITPNPCLIPQSNNEYTRVSLCENAREMWDKLQVTHEGTNRIKEAKVGMLIHEYELFSMQSKVSIFEIYNRFTIITINLKGLRNTYANKELMKKILNSLPKS